MKRSSSTAAMCVGALACLILLFNPSGAEAATITVTSPGDSGAGTLRQALLDAHSGDTINFSLPSGTTVITLTSGYLAVPDNLTISGPGANLLRVQRSTAGGTPNFRIFYIGRGTISGLTIANGSGLGGGILSQTSPNFSPTVIAGCVISGNSAGAGGTGGGIANVGAGLTITNCTLSGNSNPDSEGGAIATYAGSMTTITNSTISGNSAGYGGGGIDNRGTLALTNSTISGNSANVNGGGGIRNGGTLYARNTIIAKNTSQSANTDFEGTLTSQGYNLIGNTSGTTITGDTTGNRLNVDPLLGPLQDNGGPTPTQALLSGSPAIDKGSSSGSTTDQRGFPRPIDNSSIPNAVGGDAGDIGAYEDQTVCEAVVTNNNDGGPGSLRYCIANLCTGGNITFAPSVVSPISLTSGELLIDTPMTISGPGANLMTVQRDPSASSNFSIFDVTASGATNISGLTITRGNPNGSGGGIYLGSTGSPGNTLTITECVITGNAANAAGALSQNGGGIAVGFIGAPAVIIRRSTISGNSSTLDGGGISAGSLSITNSTISGNSAFRFGGGVSASGTTNIVNSTIANNTGATAGGVRNGGYSVTARNTIIARNTASQIGPDFGGTLTSQGYNLIGNNTGATIIPTQTSDQVGTAGSPIDPLLGLLQNNGGPTPTLALLAGSRAIDKGGSATDPVTGNPIATDQRGLVRPYDDPSIPNATGGNGSDIGAFEAAPTLTPSSVVSRKTHGNSGSFDINLPLTGSAGVECRSGGASNDYQIVFTFGSSVTFNSAAVTAGTGSVSGSSGGGTTIVTVNLTNVINAQKITVTLFGVSTGVNTGDISVQMGVLVGDTNGSGTVTASDIGQTKAQAGQPVSAANFREDVNANGAINASDIGLVKAQSGTALP